MKRQLPHPTLFALVLFLPIAAGAATIVPVSQTRTVSASAQVDGGPLVTSSFSASDFAPFDRNASAKSIHPSFPSRSVSSTVRQISSIQDARLTSEYRAEKSFSNFITFGTLAQDGVYDVTFDLLVPAEFTLWNGILRAPFEYAEHIVTLMDGNGTVIAQPVASTVSFPGADLGFPTTGVLGVGRYRLVADWNWISFFGDPVEVRGYLDFVLAPIPEPGTALLLALGLGTLAARRRR